MNTKIDRYQLEPQPSRPYVLSPCVFLSEITFPSKFYVPRLSSCLRKQPKALFEKATAGSRCRGLCRLHTTPVT